MNSMVKQVMAIFPETYAVGVQFGVVLVPAGDVAGYVSGRHDTVEVATFRSDMGYSNGRHPDEVRFSQDPDLDATTRKWVFQALREITLQNLADDPARWASWYGAQARR